MEEQVMNKVRIVAMRLTIRQYEQLEKKWKATTCKKLSDYMRRKLFDKAMVTTYRNKSLDDFMTEVIRLRNELNGLGNNFNQSVKKLHTLQHIPEFRQWLISQEGQQKILLNKVEDIKLSMQKMGEQWLQ